MSTGLPIVEMHVNEGEGMTEIRFEYCINNREVSYESVSL